MTLNDVFNNAKQGIKTSTLIKIVMKDVYSPGTVTYAGEVNFWVNQDGLPSFGGATREEYGKAPPSRLVIQVISLGTEAVPKPDPAYLAIILPSPPFVPPNEAFGPEAFIPHVTTQPTTTGVVFENPSGTIQVILHQ
jgi:hypothetical protein